MEPIVLSEPASGATARVAAHLGFSCYQFIAQVDGQPVDVIDAPPDFAEGRHRPSAYAIPVLFPYPNRIRGGQFTWEGKRYVLPPDRVAFDPTGNAIHGFCLDRPWQVTDQGENFVVGEFQLSRKAPDRRDLWPADFVLQMRYQLQGGLLRADVKITNPDQVALPWGFGTHPYFKLPLGQDSQPGRCLVEAPASQQWELVNCLPTGQKRPIPEDKDLREGAYFDVLKIDDVLSGLPEGPEPLRTAILDESAGIQVEQITDPIFRELVVYVPPGRASVCLEPYTCVTDAINLEPQGVDAGWRVLPPGESFTTWIEIHAGRIFV